MSRPPDRQEADALTEPTTGWVERTLELLADDAGVDLRAYRRATLTRRLRWQLVALGLPTLEVFYERLTKDAALRRQTTTALLIGTTSLVRDAEVFAMIEDGLEELVRRRRADGATVIRCWVPACSTGAEAYSLGIYLANATSAFGRELDWRVLATDVDDCALATAARGLVPASEVPAGLAPEVTRWLSPAGDFVAIHREVTSRVTFARHDVLGDARLAPAAAVVASFDVVSCRNLLIYLEDQARVTVCTRLLKACSKGGLLVLGRAERLPPELQDEAHARNPFLPVYTVV